MTLRTTAGLTALALFTGFGACTLESTNEGNDGSGGSGGSAGSTSAGGAGGSSSSAGGTGNAGNANSTQSSSAGGAAGAGEPGAGGAAGAADGSNDSTSSSASTNASGSGGTSSSTTGGTVPGTSDSCEESDVEPNEDRDSATAYEIGTPFQGCLQDINDIDVYEFSVPEDDRGGVITIRITDVGVNGDTSASVWSVADNGEFHSDGTNTDGGSLFLQFTAAPGAAFRLEVTNYLSVDSPNPYLLTIDYDQAPDEHEPNDTRPDAVSIEVGEEVEGYTFAGWENSTGIPDEAWYDWYQIDLAAGATEFLMDVVASDIDSSMTLYNPLGTQIHQAGTNTEGSSLLMTYTIEEAGTYFVRLAPYLPPNGLSRTVDLPEYATIPYTLTVTQ